MPSADPVPRNPREVALDAPGGAAYRDEILAECRRAGLAHAGVAPAAVLGRAREQIRDRAARGLVNGMKFTFLDPERSTDPTRLVKDARSVIVAARPYGYAEPDGDAAAVTASVARYAWFDHYAELKSSLTTVAARLRRDGHRATVFADDNAVVDREVAWLAGLGWFGKNANILVPGAGSMHVLGCIVTTADLPRSIPVDDGCGSCSRCIPACPTGAIVAPGVIDANRCLSWLLQKPGVFDPAHRVALGDRIYGCDECQTACPFNRRDAGPAPDGATARVDVVALLSAPDDRILRECDRWWVHDRDAAWVRRNLLIVLGNVADPAGDGVRRVVEAHLAHPSPHVRGQAAWTAARLGFADALSVLDGDDDPVVREEMSRLPALRDDLWEHRRPGTETATTARETGRDGAP